MLSLLDVADRSQKGPKMEEKMWNLGLFRKMATLTNEFNVQIPDQIGYFNYDLGIADRVFQAAVEFLSTSGAYCLTTSRVVQFSREEVLQAAREAPSSILVGEGRDQRTIMRREPSSDKRVNQHYGGHAPFDEELLPMVVKNFAQIPSNDYLESHNFTCVDGREVHGLPLEAYAARRAVAWARQGIRQAGRPGMAVALYPISTRPAALIAPMDPQYGLRRTDGVLLSVLPDVKIEQDLLTAAIVYQDYGAFLINGGGGGGFLGSFSGSLAGAMVEGVVKHLTGWMCYHDSFGYGTGVDVLGHTPLPPEVVASHWRALHWASHVIAQALQRHTSLILWGLSGASWGATAKAYLWRSAMSSIRNQVAGVNGGGAGRHAQKGIAVPNASQTPLEAELASRVGDAVLRQRMDYSEAERLLAGIASELDEEARKEHWLPKHVDELYDFVHHQPVGDYARSYLEVEDRLAAFGLPLD